MDGSFGAGGLAGAAVSRTDGETGYAYGAAEGRLETSLRSLYPYLRGASGRFAYWGIGGIGRGDAAWMRAGRGDRYEGDLEMRLGAVGGEFALTAWGATRLALVGDAGQAGLDIVADGGPLAGLSSSVSRARLGLELSRRTSGDDAGAWTVSGGLRTRYDGGEGLSGAGLEVTGSVGYAGRRLELEARGRWLAAHAGQGVASPEETGASLRIHWKQAPDGTGLRLLVSPEWGETARAESFWQSDSLSAMQGRLAGLERPGASWSAELGYGLQRRGLWTPLLEVGSTPFGGQSLATGWDYARTLRWGNLGLQLRVEQVGQGMGGLGPDRRLLLKGVLRFGGVASARPTAAE